VDSKVGSGYRLVGMRVSAFAVPLSVLSVPKCLVLLYIRKKKRDNYEGDDDDVF